MQLPSSIVLLRYLSFLLHARISGRHPYTWDKPFDAFFLYFILYAVSTVVFQVRVAEVNKRVTFHICCMYEHTTPRLWRSCALPECT